MMEAPKPPDTVENCCFSADYSCHPSRSVPVFGVGEGVFQVANLGKYDNITALSLPEICLIDSAAFMNGVVDTVPRPDAQPLPIIEPEQTASAFLPASGPNATACASFLTSYSATDFDGIPDLRPGNARNSICPAEAVNGTARQSSTSNFQNDSSVPTPVTLACNEPVSDANNKLRVYYQNVRGVRTKIDDVFLAVSSCHYDVIVLTETWLDDKIFSPQLFGDSYTVYRTDRSNINSHKSRGGGVLIAVSTNFNGYIDPTPVNVSLEQLWVKLKLHQCSVSIGVIYLPPDRKNDLLSVNNHIESIEAIHSHLGNNDHAILLGDYNQSGLVWNTPSNDRPSVDALQSHISVACASLLDGFNLHGLYQVNYITNQNMRILDFALVNEATLSRCQIEAAVEPLSFLDADHPAFEVTISLAQPTEFESFPDEPGLDFHRADFGGLLEALRQTDWHILESAEDIDIAVEYFTSVLKSYLVDFVPLRRPSSKPPWGNIHLRRLKRLRSKALRTYCQSRCPFSKQHFARASNNYRTYNRYLYKRYCKRTQENLRRHPRHFWKFVDSKRKENGLPVEMFLGDEVATSALEKCNLFATHFRRAFNDSTSSARQITEACRDTPSGVCSLRSFAITSNQVDSAINKLKYSVSSPDGIPSCILKKCGEELIFPLTTLFNISLRKRSFPTSWKTSVMFPVFKKGDRQNIENYRGITSLCACSKVFEIIINDVLFNSCKNYISTDQHGFYPKRSTSTNLVQFTSFCIRNIDAGAQIDTAYTDLKSAFDRVDHGILLKRLGRIGVSADLVSWFGSYLTDRSLTVNIGFESSEQFSNLSGVPQGSNLGPLLFSLFINELSLVLPSGCRVFYADDVKIYMIIKGIEDCYALQLLLNSFADWCTRNMLTLSIHKCNVISFHRKLNPITYDYSINGQSLERCLQVRDLGVILDSALTFRSHYNDIICRANRQLGFMFKISCEFTDPLCLRSLYCALVRSILESNSVVWCPYQSTWTGRIEAIQRKFVRYALRRLPWRDPLNLPQYGDRCRLLGLQTLEQRRNDAQAVFVAKLLTGETDAPELLGQLNLYVPERLLRQRNFLLLEPRNSLYGLHDPVRFMSTRFNEVYILFDFNSTVATFKRRLTELH